MRFLRTLALLTLVAAVQAQAQTLDVTFRYVPGPEGAFVRAFLPGEFNGWGQPYVSGTEACIQPGHSSAMQYVDSLDQWIYRSTLVVGPTFNYKVQLHRNDAGTNCTWLSDPLNLRTDPADPFQNSLVTVSDPMVFQLAREGNHLDSIHAVSAGVFGTEVITALTFEINGEPADGLPHFDAESGIFRYVLDTPVVSGSKFKVTAVDATNRVVSDSVGIIPPDVVDAPRPAGVEDGVTYHEDPSTVTLSLFAPGTSYVHLIGDFNDWSVSEDYLMFRDAPREDSVHWWIDIDGLEPGVEYAFQYLVDGDLRLADPFSHKILDPTHDAFIPASTYPDLKAYPAGKTQHIASVLETGREPFAFAPFERPPQHELLIYELLLRDFIDKHDFATLIDTLDYLEQLGVNAIELMPVSEFSGNDSWGYNPTFALALDKYYGPADDLKRLVDEAHSRGLAVILDVVYNHQADESPLVRLYGPTDGNPFINVPARHPFSVFFDLNHEHPYIQYWLDRANRYWLEEFNVDGYRFDLSKGFMQTGSFHGYNPSRMRLLERMADRIWEIDPTAYVILEHFGDPREEEELATYGMDRGRPGMLFWAKETDPYNEATMGWHSGGKSDFRRIYHTNRGMSVPHAIGFMESHDEQWLMYKNLQYGSCTNGTTNHTVCRTNPGPYNVQSLSVALDRMKAAGTFFFTVPGPKMLWQFGELGYGYGERGEQCLKPGDGSDGDCPSFAPGRTARKPIRWDYREDPLRWKLYDTWAALLGLRRDHEVFRSPDTEVTMHVSGAVKRMYLAHPDLDVAIVGNFDVVGHSGVSPGFMSTGWWYDFFGADSVLVGEPEFTIDLEPGQFHLFTSERVDFPTPGLITVSTEQAGELPAQVILHPNYPNPFNPSTTVTYSLPRMEDVRLEVFDILGRRVATLVDGVKPAGKYTVVFEANGLPSGAYVYRLEAGGQVQSRVMVLAK